MRNNIIHKAILVLSSILALGCAPERDIMNIEPLKNFAILYSPLVDKNTDCDGIPSVPVSVENILENRNIDEEYRGYVALIFLKLYNCQLGRYGQSFGLPSGSKLYGAYREVMGDVSKEFISAADVLVWLEENPKYISNPEVTKALSETYNLFCQRGFEVSDLPALPHSSSGMDM